MGNINRRVERLEKIAAPTQTIDKHQLAIDVRGERCDVVLQRELEKKGITLSEVSHLSITTDIHSRPKRDFQDYPEWELFMERQKKPGASGGVWEIMIVDTKEEWEEYQEYERTARDIL